MSLRGCHHTRGCVSIEYGDGSSCCCEILEAILLWGHHVSTLILGDLNLPFTGAGGGSSIDVNVDSVARIWSRNKHMLSSAVQKSWLSSQRWFHPYWCTLKLCSNFRCNPFWLRKLCSEMLLRWIRWGPYFPFQPRGLSCCSVQSLASVPRITLTDWRMVVNRGMGSTNSKHLRKTCASIVSLPTFSIDSSRRRMTGSKISGFRLVPKINLLTCKFKSKNIKLFVDLT